MTEPTKIEMEPFESCDTYKDFKKRYKKVLKTLSMKRENDLDSLLVNIWNLSTKKFKEGYDQGITEKVSAEELRKQSDYVGPIFFDDTEGELY